MAKSPSGNPLARLVPEVLQFTSSPFVLRDDLTSLLKVHRARVPEAVIFYGARILEVLTAVALQSVQLPADANPFGNLDLLQQYDLISTATRYWAHALRRLGNDVRHIQRQVVVEEADLAVSFVEDLLGWFFCRLPHGLRLPALTQDGKPLGASGRVNLQAMIALLDQEDADTAALLELWGEGRNRLFLKTPALAAVLAEKLLDCQQPQQALLVLESARKTFGEDQRLCQLLGLYWSRTGELSRAVALLEPIWAAHRDDEETSGILAGVYKRRWLKDRKQLEWLQKAHKLYSQVWERAKKTSPYLGINSATTALWLENRPAAQQVADEVQTVLLERAKKLSHGADPDLALNYWDQATLAESQLLLGQFERSRQTYLRAFQQHARQLANIAVSKSQAFEILQSLGPPAPSGKEFFESGTGP